jgi:hypothetical protein
MTKHYSDDELIESIQNFAAHLGKTPTAAEVNADTTFTKGINTYNRRFGGWNKTLKACNLQPNEQKNYTKSYLIEQLHDLRDRLGKVPTQHDLRDDSTTPSPFPYDDTFGSWNKALHAAGLQPTQRHNIGDDELLEELTALADELNRPPRYAELETRSDTFSPGVYERVFGSFTDALRAAALPVEFEPRVNKELLVEKLQALGEELGRTPTYEDLREYPTYPSAYPYTCVFRTWNDALRAAGYEINERATVSPDEIITQLQAVAKELGQTPSVTEWKALNDRFGITTIVRHFDSWVNAIDAAGLERRDWSGENHPAYKGGESLYYGPQWDQQREVAIQADSQQCRRCGLTRDEHYVLFDCDLAAHHIRPFRECRNAGLSYAEANARDNLMALCCECHPVVEAHGL